jgi:predicted adenylyl cyclase CyaB
MPRNIEIKARAADLADLEQRVKSLAPHHSEQLSQDDTFFRSTSGRLKLRVLAQQQGELIFYQRLDSAGPKTSFYVHSPTSDPDGLREALSLAYGQIGRVRKQRMVYLVGRTRIHLDEVEGLGNFVELEVVLADDEPVDAGEAEAHRLMQALGIQESDLLGVAYLDLLNQAGRTTSVA